VRPLDPLKTLDIGFLGLGTMGSAMAANLVRAGHRVCVWNRSAEPVAALVARGARRATTPTDVAQTKYLISMLADDKAAREVLLDDAVIRQLAPDGVHMSMSTISVALARELTAAHTSLRRSYLAAPVLGRPDLAASGNLTILAAGAAPLIARAQPVLNCLGRVTWPVGDEPAQANAVKLAINVMLASAIEAMGEATALVSAHGVRTKSFIELLTSTLFQGPVYATYGALLAERRYRPAGFKLSLGLKDVLLALEASDVAHVHMPFANILRDHLSSAVERGDGDLDLAALAERALGSPR
jgi:3-hydroxyisobutyrate dehydrogenase-like beta-hydroxyacid dehydrogenase